VVRDERGGTNCSSLGYISYLYSTGVEMIIFISNMMMCSGSLLSGSGPE